MSTTFSFLLCLIVNVTPQILKDLLSIWNAPEVGVRFNGDFTQYQPDSQRQEFTSYKECGGVQFPKYLRLRRKGARVIWSLEKESGALTTSWTVLKEIEVESENAVPECADPDFRVTIYKHLSSAVLISGALELQQLNESFAVIQRLEMELASIREGSRREVQVPVTSARDNLNLTEHKHRCHFSPRLHPKNDEIVNRDLIVNYTMEIAKIRKEHEVERLGLNQQIDEMSNQFTIKHRDILLICSSCAASIIFVLFIVCLCRCCKTKKGVTRTFSLRNRLNHQKKLLAVPVVLKRSRAKSSNKAMGLEPEEIQKASSHWRQEDLNQMIMNGNAANNVLMDDVIADMNEGGLNNVKGGTRS